jgi:3-oxoacyl-[acyl-carrier-protein] synthase III
MIESLKKNETFQYQKLTPEEMVKRGILGRLVGPCADFINPTRNGRKYTEELWENVFKDSLIQEKINNGVCFGELGHPTDRTETDMTKIAVSLREAPKKNDKGQLVAYFDILDTPNGRILKTLCDYGSTIGISSRGTGDVIEDENGNEMVDPKTYEFECWDVVLIPAVETARLQYVTESLGSEKKDLKMALNESLEKATAEERKVMENTLKELNIEVEQPKIGSIPEKDENIDAKIVEEVKTPQQAVEKADEATVSGSDELIKSLQEALKAKVSLEAQVKSLQEQLAVNDIKVGKVNEELGKYKDAIARLSSTVAEKKKLQDKVSTLEEQLKNKDEAIGAQKQRISRLVEATKVDTKPAQALTEAVASKDGEIAKLNESLTTQKVEHESQVAKLNESIKALKTSSESKEKEGVKKIERLEKLKESYKKLANETVSHYIKSKAEMLGVKEEEIKNRLPESYTIEDIDSICEELQSYELNISKLPFSVDRKVKVKVRESRNENLPVDKVVDDDVDASLLSLAGINK